MNYPNQSEARALGGAEKTSAAIHPYDVRGNPIKIPATVVTGFLGSGKTSLLRHVLGHAGGRRIAVIVNEFGEQGVDAELLKSCDLGCEERTDAGGEAGEYAAVSVGEAGDGHSTGDVADNIYELANGCLCCTVQEAFLPVLEELVRRRASVDHILIETSGLALPKPLVQAFQWPQIRSACTVDAVITVVDGPAVVSGQFAANPQAVALQRASDNNLDHESPLHELFADQLSAADLVILNKNDQLSDAQRDEIKKIIREEAPPSVKIIKASWGRVDVSALLDLNLASEERIDERASHHDHHHASGEAHVHAHDHFDSASVHIGGVALPRLLEVLRDIVHTHEVYRIKGFVYLPDKAMRLVLHAVGARLSHYFDRHWTSDEVPATRIVFIGRNLNAEQLKKELMQAEVLS